MPLDQFGEFKQPRAAGEKLSPTRPIAWTNLAAADWMTDLGSGLKSEKWADLTSRKEAYFSRQHCTARSANQPPHVEDH